MSNVRHGTEANFLKKEWLDPLGTDYDCNSVMHYDSFAFSKVGNTQRLHPIGPGQLSIIPGPLPADHLPEGPEAGGPVPDGPEAVLQPGRRRQDQPAVPLQGRRGHHGRRRGQARRGQARPPQAQGRAPVREEPRTSQFTHGQECLLVDYFGVITKVKKRLGFGI